MLLQQRKLEMLSVLSDNLLNPRPLPMRTSVIASRLNVGEAELHTVLKVMHGIGFIETDPDLSYTLITRSGLSYLKEQGAGHDRKQN